MSEQAYKRTLEILSAYVSGALDEDLMRKIRRWLISSRGDADKQRALYDFFEREFQYQKIPDEKVYRSFEVVSKRLGLEEMSDEEYDRLAGKIYHQPSAIPPEIIRRQWTGRRMLRIAAVVIPLLMIAGASLLLLSGPQPAAPQVAMVTVCVPDTPGAQARADLADGTDILIHPGSTIRYARDFDEGRQRHIVLDCGKVYLKVAKDHTRPFVVQTPHLNVNVLGTTFNVETDPDQHCTIVTLYTGQVKINGINGVTEISMKPGQRLFYNNATGQYKMEQAYSTLPDWIAQRLTFHNTPLGEVFRTIEWYWGVKVEPDEGLDLSTLYTFRYRGNERIDTAMSIVENVLLDFTFRIEGNTVKVRMKK